MSKFRLFQWAMVVFGLTCLAWSLHFHETDSALTGYLVGLYFGWQSAELMRR